ncbi:hypothetical protein [Azotobacter beijerinckii]|uniref:Uncharacterized protein n=1 Tax=Azotobacter beijerinckii TaxID=170623 RepID=A0A1I4E8F7_9GAMM|nr:hypothetical protein [Azotobacter beijerinckii]SFB46831.1 hypothetical protein SAMN04244571_03028 [Azotobacter beijerinckii]SFL01563.1 hypothetical protein SAMN04244574_02777 [Azotobacter beijerinckii]
MIKVLARNVLRITFLLVVVLVCFWFLLFSFYGLASYSPLERISPGLAEFLRHQFSSEVGSARENWQFRTEGIQGGLPSQEALEVEAFVWAQNCLPSFAAEDGRLARMQMIRSMVVDVNKTLMLEIDRSKGELQSLQEVGDVFSSVIVVLGMLVTIFTALNASEFRESARLSVPIKVVSIVLPATLTAVTAFGEIYADPDESAKKFQLYNDLVGLKTQLVSGLLVAECPLNSPDAFSRMEANMVEWSRRFLEVMSNVEGSESAYKRSRPEVNVSSQR